MPRVTKEYLDAIKFISNGSYGKTDIQNLLKKLSKEGMTIFYSSHILGEVEDIASRVGILYQGKLQRVLEGNEIEKVAEIYKEITAVRSEIPKTTG